MQRLQTDWAEVAAMSANSLEVILLLVGPS